MDILIDQDTLATRITSLGREIREAHGEDASIVAICVLKGSVLFFADLVRAIGGDVRLEFLGVSSYEGTSSTGEVRITHDLRTEIRGRHVVVGEDIVDTGLTLSFLLKALRVRDPASLTVAALLDKPSKRTVDVHADHVGFSIDDHFVIGYGLDLDEKYRNLPFVAIYRPGVG